MHMLKNENVNENINCKNKELNRNACDELRRILS